MVEAYTGFWSGNLKGGDHLEDPGVDERIILRWIFRKRDVWVWVTMNWLRIWTWWALVNAVMNLRVP
jgi:hypothetical protein